MLIKTIKIAWNMRQAKKYQQKHQPLRAVGYAIRAWALKQS